MQVNLGWSTSVFFFCETKLCSIPLNVEFNQQLFSRTDKHWLLFKFLGFKSQLCSYYKAEAIPAGATLL